MANSLPASPFPASYQVFINHRGPEVKKTFASHLYRRLTSEGLRVFLDKQELEGGEEINSQIQNAISETSVHVAIFSPRYAQSEWCLNELVLMWESCKSGSVILPVFYDVKPSELRTERGNGNYAKALRDLEMKQTGEGKPRYNSATIEKWRNALVRVAGISGFELEAYNGDEGELLDKVVESVLKKVKNVDKSSFKVADYLVGVDEKVEDFEKTVLLQQQQQSGKPQVVGIVGLGGIGKTTLATELFNRKRLHYSSWHFLNVKEKLGTDEIDKTIEEISKKDENFQAFVVLDDVAGDKSQVNEVLKAFQNVLNSTDSLILITSRDRDVLPACSSIYTLCGLNPQYSRELFCSHAFGRPHPRIGCEQKVEKFLEACDGLPLSLKVFGSLLRKENENGSREGGLNIQKGLPREIEQTLKISYEGLDMKEKEMFLDTASFLIDEKRDMAIRIWDGSGWKGSEGFQILENKSLLEVDNENKIKMHNHLRDLGREIVDEVSGLPRRPYRWTENINDMLLQLDENTEVRGIRTGNRKDSDQESQNKSSSHSLYTKPCRPENKNLRLLDVEDGCLKYILKKLHLPNLLWLRWRDCSYPYLPECVPMENLRVLQVYSNVLKKLWRGKSKPPLQLRELVINSPLSKLPKSTGKLKHLELIILNCPSGSLKTFPNKFCDIKSLKRFDLTNCSEIKSLPDSFGSLTNLEHIDLSGSENLQRLPDSFGYLIRLKYLNLRHCNNLTISSKTLGNISTLEYINLSYCGKVKVLPPQVAQQRSLEKLYCPFLEMVPSPLGVDLKELRLRNCNNCEELRCWPISAGLLNQLTKLTVNECVFSELPLENKGETETSRPRQSSREGTLSNFVSSIDMSKLLRLRYLELYKTKISEVSFAEGVCPDLQHLLIKCCDQLVKVGTLPNALIKLELTSCSQLKKIEGLCGLAKLQMLNIKWCKEVVELSNIETLVSLEALDVNECRKLKRIHRLAQLTKLRRLEIVRCSELEELPGVSSSELEELPGVGHLMSLKWLDASECPKLQWADGVLERLRQQVRHINI